MKTFKQFIEESAKKKLILKGYQTLKSVIKKPKVKRILKNLKMWELKKQNLKDLIL